MERQPNNIKTPPSENNRWLVFIAVFLIILGQIFLYATPINNEIIIPNAMFLTIAGVMLFLVSFIKLNLAARLKTKFGWSLNKPQAWGLIGLAFSLLATIATVNFEKAGLSNYTSVVIFWLISGLCYISGFVDSSSNKQEILNWIRTHRLEIGQVGLITVLAAVLRFYQLGDLPRVINGDEALIGMHALSSYNPVQANPFAFWENIGNLYLHTINAGLLIMGTTPLGLRVLPAIAGVLAIPATYLLARQIAGHRIALITITLLAFTHTHLHFSRTVAVSYIQGNWLTPLALYFFLSGLNKRSYWRTALSGCLIAVHLAIYLDAQIITGLVLAYTIIAAIFLRSWFKTIYKQALTFWGGLGIMILPGLTYFWNRPEEFFNRLNAGGTFQTGWLAQEVIRTGQNEAQILLGRVVHAFLSLIYYPALDFYGSPTPILSLISASLFLVGMSLALWQTSNRNVLLLNGYFWGGTVAIAIFSTPPSADSYRMLIAVPPALIMVSIGLDKLLETFGVGWQQSRKTYLFATGVIVISLFIFNIWTYFFEFAGRCRYGGDTQTRFASYLGNYARAVDRESDIYLLSNEVFFYGSHASVDFLSGKRRIINIPEPIDSFQLVSGETVIANPDRVEELESWIRTRPGGEIRYLYDCERIILLAYQLP